MRFKISILLSVMWMPLMSQALTRFPKGTCRMQGLLVKGPEKKNWYFVVNSTTPSETRFKLDAAPNDKKLSADGQFVEATVAITKDTDALYGEATLQKVEKFLTPLEDAKQYVHTSEVKHACEISRAPASVK